MGGCQVEAADFICATRMGIASLCSPRPVVAWGPSCSEQGGVWEGVRGRNFGVAAVRRSGSSSGTQSRHRGARNRQLSQGVSSYCNFFKLRQKKSLEENYFIFLSVTSVFM